MSNAKEFVYVVKPAIPIDAAFVWRHGILDDAKKEAEKLATEHNTDVLVLKILGTYKRQTLWSKESGE